LAITDIAANQAIHRQWGFHVAFYVGDRCQLVWGFFVLERFFEFLLPFRIRRKRIAACDLSLSVQLQEVLSHVADCALRTRLTSDPGRTTKLIELRLGPFCR